MKIWFDMDNAPHVLVLGPIIGELSARGHEVLLTARRYGQTTGLLDYYGMPYKLIGCHAGRNRLRKIASTVARSLALAAYVEGRKPDLAFSHCSRSCLLAARALGIPSLVMFDYEHIFLPAFMANWAKHILVPETISRSVLLERGIEPSKLVTFPGLKEELYIHTHCLDGEVLAELGVDPQKVIVVVRPPATMAHYHKAESAELFWSSMRFLLSRREAQVILLPRTADQFAGEMDRLSRLDVHHNLVIPDHVVHGPSLIYCADLIISGGGTMNREAACLDIPVYSIYCGPVGGVDRHLSEAGRLTFLQNPGMVERIPLQKKKKPDTCATRKRAARLIGFIADTVQDTQRATVPA